MKVDVIKTFIKHLGSSNVDVAGDWVKASCPLARYKHKSGHDKNPSFGIKIEPNKPSHFNCWACNTGGSLETLLLELVHLSKGNIPHDLELAEAYKLVDADELSGFHQSNWSEFVVGDIKEKFRAWDEYFLNSFITADKSSKAMEYLATRNIDLDIVMQFDIRYDSTRNTVAFPFRNSNQKLAGMRGRFINPTDDRRYHDYDWYPKGSTTKVNNTKHIWFNEHKVDWGRTIVLAEGAFDVVAIYQQYQNVMSPLSTGMSFEKIDRLKQAVKIICFFDNDVAGDLAYQKIKKAVGNSTIVKKIEYLPNTPVGYDASALNQSIVQGMLEKFVPVNPLK